MFQRKKPIEKSELEQAISEVLFEMHGFGSESDEYAQQVDQLVKLHALKECEVPQRVSKDTMLIVAGNIVGILLILTYERANVVTSKALNFLFKLR